MTAAHTAIDTAIDATHDAALQSWRRSANAFIFETTAHTAVRIDVLTPGIARVRCSADGRFPTAAPIRWGFVRDDWPPCDVL